MQASSSPTAGRRIVLATNVAETSLTVPGIRYVIDPGFARISRYSRRAARSSGCRSSTFRQAMRRPAQGPLRPRRPGRLHPPLHRGRLRQPAPQFTEPEILRTNLASVILQMKSLRLGEVQDFPFLEPPDYRADPDGYQTLHELGAIDENNQLTPLGRMLAKLPIDPQIGRMILAASDEDCSTRCSSSPPPSASRTPASARSTSSRPPTRPTQVRATRTATSSATSTSGDWFNEMRDRLSTSQLRKACRTNFLSYVRMREWHDVHHQLRELLTTTDPTRGDRNRRRNADPPPARPAAHRFSGGPAIEPPTRRPGRRTDGANPSSLSTARARSTDDAS